MRTLLIFATLVIALVGCGPKPTALDGPPEPAIARRNLATGLMGQFKYDDARGVLESLVNDYPNWWEARVDLAIATLNRQTQGDEQRALELLDQVLEADETNLRARYCAGILKLYVGDSEQAAPLLAGVLEDDPRDAYAAYFLGQSQLQLGHSEKALEAFNRAAELNPYLRSAYYGRFMALRQLGRIDEAKQMMGQFQSFADHPRAEQAEFKYTKMGSKAMVGGGDWHRQETAQVPDGPLFEPPATIVSDAKFQRASLSHVDIDGDGVLEIAVCGQPEGAGDGLRVFREEGGSWVQMKLEFAALDGINAVLWGDVDNNGDVDAYLCTDGVNQLWLQSQGTWKASSDAVVTGGEAVTESGLLVDQDHDGDLDVMLVQAQSGLVVISNNADGSFRDITDSFGDDLAGIDAILAFDQDGDRDLDFAFAGANRGVGIWRNELAWTFTRSAILPDQGPKALLALDHDGDGSTSIWVQVREGGIQRWDQEQAGWSMGLELAVPDLVGMAYADLDGDMEWELVAVGRTAIDIIDCSDGEVASHFKVEDPIVGWDIGNYDSHGAEMMLLGESGALTHLSAGSGRYQFVTLHLSGREEKAESMRSNASAIGTRVTAKAGSLWSIQTQIKSGSGSSQSLGPIALGTAGYDHLDYVYLLWPDGVLQSEVGPESGMSIRLEETQRQLSSCPLVFSWNGETYAFVTDVLGVGGVGFALGPDTYAEPRPWEWLSLDASKLAPREGAFEIKLGEPMEELMYLDSVRLHAFDLPPGWHMVFDERLGHSEPLPTGEPLYYRREHLPVAASNDRQQDVLAAIANVDGMAAPVGPVDSRFLGRLRKEHVLTLEFDGVVSADSLALVIDGWVEYPYSQTMFAAWQAGAEYHAPSLEVRDLGGRWHMVHPDFGYPAGMPRRMALPLDWSEPLNAVRLRTNQEVYWDRIALVETEPCPQADVNTLDMIDGVLRQVGFPLRRTLAQKRPQYDYAERTPFWDTRYQSGRYTQFGDVTELVNRTDQAVAIVGPGEETHLRFDARLGDPPAGWTRTFGLECHGWCKDMDLYTRDGASVEPIPGEPGPHRRRLHARYQNRYQGGQSTDGAPR